MSGSNTLSFKDRLQACLHISDMSIESLINATGIPKEELDTLFKGTQPSKDELDKIGYALNVNCDWLKGDEAYVIQYPADFVVKESAYIRRAIYPYNPARYSSDANTESIMLSYDEFKLIQAYRDLDINRKKQVHSAIEKISKEHLKVK